MKPVLVAILIAVLSASTAHARTWRVEKDGSGDYTVIQDALDAAASGDTIRIGPGRFEEFRIYPTNGGDQAVIAMVQVAEITFIGSGIDQTIIGPTSFDWQDGDPPTRGVNCIAQSTSGKVVVERLAHENLFSGVYVENAGPLTVTDCSFRGCRYGINAFVSSVVERSDITDCRIGIWIKAPGVYGTVTGCRFVDVEGTAVSFQSLESGIASDCRFSACIDCNTVGVQCFGSGGGIYDCVFEGLLQPIYMTSAAYPEILRNRAATAGICLYSNSEAFTAEGNVFQATGPFPALQLYSRGLPHTIRGNHILRGTGLAVEVLGHTGPEDYHLDMTGNWWGTTDRDSISAWIHDGNDVMWPPGGLVECTVDFEPIAEAPIPTEKKSLGGLKALFLGR
ncbi:MAG: right-handed parallel beta-helix repeat-containing protein [Krumholzibacteria bacterium]|nr:right-handed parallel beta-helix repeat-containing protein [Candidatus Krumholzibacteria bacterium]